MSPEETKAFVIRFLEPMNTARYADYGNGVAPGFACHGPSETLDVEGLKTLHRKLRQAFPDFHLVIDDAFTCGDRIGVRGMFRGTHKGTFMGKEPTGKLIEWSYISLWRLKDGNVAEEWYLVDEIGLRKQIGVL